MQTNPIEVITNSNPCTH